MYSAYFSIAVMTLIVTIFGQELGDRPIVHLIRSFVYGLLWPIFGVAVVVAFVYRLFTTDAFRNGLRTTEAFLNDALERTVRWALGKKDE